MLEKQAYESEQVDQMSTIASAVFRTFGWTWFGKNDPPSQIDIREKLSELIGLAEGCVSIGSGRLIVINEGDSYSVSIEIGRFTPGDDLSDDFGEDFF
jgi:hypothetical protein